MKAIKLIAAALLLTSPAWANPAADKRDCAGYRLDSAGRIAACTRAIESGQFESHELSWMYRKRGLNHSYLDQEEQALADLAKALEIDPQDPETYRARASVHSSIRQFEAALADYGKALEFDPRDASTYYRRGVMHARLDKYDEAMADYNKALNLNPNLTEPYNTRGHLHVRMEAFDSAVSDFNEVLAKKPYRAPAYAGRGEAHEKLGQAAEAIHDFRLAQILDPNLGAPEPALERLVVAPAEAAAGGVAYKAPESGRKITYIQIRTTAKALEKKPKKDEMEEAIGDLIVWFKAPKRERKPLPAHKTFLHREIVSTEDSTTAVTAQVLSSPGSTSGESRTVTYYRSLWPTIMPAGRGPTLRVDYDRAALDGLWPLEPGKTGTGTASLNMICPGAGDPMAAMLQCQEGEAIPMGKIDWQANVVKWEDIVVPAGAMRTMEIRYNENVELNFLGRPLKRQAATTWWFSPELGWWVKRVRQENENVDLAEAERIE